MVQDEDDLGADAEPQDTAAEAFERLRGEVAQLRGAVEALAGRRGEKAPDYAPTLAVMVKILERIEAHPALRQTAGSYGAEVSRAVESIRHRFETETQQALTSIARASSEVRQFAGDLRSRDAQRKAVIYGVASGLVGGVVLWVLLSGPTARALPASWQVPERMAAATLHADMWDAGARIMNAASPADWNRIVFASRVHRDNAEALAACAQAAEKAGKAQPCRVVVGPAKFAQAGR